jgi:hypothetical protein
VPIVRTAHGGLHIYTNRGEYTQSTNRYCKAFVGNGYDVDVFASIDPDKRSLVVLPTTTVIESGKTLKYSWAQGDEGTEIGATVDDVLKALNFDIAGQLKAKEIAFEKLVMEAPTTNTKTDEVRRQQSCLSNKSTNSKPLTLERFKLLISGFKDIEIHNDTRGTDDEITLMPLFTTLNSCREYIGDDEVENAYDTIFNTAKLTQNATRNWDIAKARYDGQTSPTGYGLLIKYVKTFASEYYNEHIKTKRSFNGSTYTFEDYREKCSTYYSKQLHVYYLAQCLAINVSGGYILKKRDEATIYRYEGIGSDKLKSFFDFSVSIKLTEEEKQAQKANKHGSKDWMEISIHSLIRASYCQSKLTRVEASILDAVIPPRPTEKRLDMNIWLAKMLNGVVHQKPLIDMISAHAVKRRTGVRPNKVYALHDTFGNTGKTYMMYCLASIYGTGRTNVEVKTEQIENDKFNDWMSYLEMLNVDEPQNGNYKNRKFEAFLKLCTNHSMSFRGMQKEAKMKDIRFIASFASNEADLYGIVRADPAVLSRLCIIEFKERLDTEEFYQWTHEEFNPETPEFKYSMDQWLLNEFVIPEWFSLDRYKSPEKDAFIARSRQVKRNSVEQWLTSEFEDTNEFDQIFQRKTFKNIGYTVVIEAVANRHYKDFMRGRDKPFGEDGLVKSLIAQGFEQYKYSGVRYLRIQTSKFDALKTRYSDHLPELEPDCDEDCGL